MNIVWLPLQCNAGLRPFPYGSGYSGAETAYTFGRHTSHTRRDGDRLGGYGQCSLRSTAPTSTTPSERPSPMCHSPYQNWGTPAVRCHHRQHFSSRTRSPHSRRRRKFRHRGQNQEPLSDKSIRLPARNCVPADLPTQDSVSFPVLMNKLPSLRTTSSVGPPPVPFRPPALSVSVNCP